MVISIKNLMKGSINKHQLGGYTGVYTSGHIHSPPPEGLSDPPIHQGLQLERRVDRDQRLGRPEPRRVRQATWIRLDRAQRSGGEGRQLSHAINPLACNE